MVQPVRVFLETLVDDRKFFAEDLEHLLWQEAEYFYLKFVCISWYLSLVLLRIEIVIKRSDAILDCL